MLENGGSGFTSNDIKVSFKGNGTGAIAKAYADFGEESKLAIGKANSEHQKGEKNSQFGSCWIYNPELKQNKKIKKEELDSWIQQGWIKGRIL